MSPPDYAPHRKFLYKSQPKHRVCFLRMGPTHRGWYPPLYEWGRLRYASDEIWEERGTFLPHSLDRSLRPGQDETRKKGFSTAHWPLIADPRRLPLAEKEESGGREEEKRNVITGFICYHRCCTAISDTGEYITGAEIAPLSWGLQSRHRQGGLSI